MNHYRLCLSRPVLALYISVFGGLIIVFIRLIYTSALFWLPVAVIPVTCHSQFDLYLLSFSLTSLLSTPPKFLHSFHGQKQCT